MTESVYVYKIKKKCIVINNQLKWLKSNQITATSCLIILQLCEHAQQWANHLASTNEFYYRPQKNLGQNLFCCPISALVTDLSGSYIYLYIKQLINLHLIEIANCAPSYITKNQRLLVNLFIYSKTGQEVASYWYSTVRRYNYFKDTNLLHTNVNAGENVFLCTFWLN